MNSASHKTQKAIQLIERVQALDLARPGHKTMIDDIKMTNVKIRSIEGDIFSLKHDEDRFVQSLWKITQIEQIAREAAELLDESEAEHFFSYLDSRTQWRSESDLDESTAVRTVKLEVFNRDDIDPRLVN